MRFLISSIFTIFILSIPSIVWGKGVDGNGIICATHYYYAIFFKDGDVFRHTPLQKNDVYELHKEKIGTYNNNADKVWWDFDSGYYRFSLDRKSLGLTDKLYRTTYYCSAYSEKAFNAKMKENLYLMQKRYNQTLKKNKL